MNDQRRYVLITGAASGLGQALAVRLAHEGWWIGIADVDSAGSQETLRQVEAAGGGGQVERLDVSQLDQWQALSTRLRADWPRLDLLVNNAGIGCSGDLGVFPLDEWRNLLSINLYGAIYGCHTLVDWLKANQAGSHLINVASFAAIAPSPSMSAYNVAKAGVVSLSETLYSELRPFGVGVTVVCPLFFRSQIQSAARMYNPKLAEAITARIETTSSTSDDVAAAALNAMRRKQLYAMPSRQARWYWFLRRLSPRGFLDGMAREAAAQDQAPQE